MSAMGQKATSTNGYSMSALPPENGHQRPRNAMSAKCQYGRALPQSYHAQREGLFRASGL